MKVKFSLLPPVPAEAGGYFGARRRKRKGRALRYGWSTIILRVYGAIIHTYTPPQTTQLGRVLCLAAACELNFMHFCR